MSLPEGEEGVKKNELTPFFPPIFLPEGEEGVKKNELTPFFSLEK